jgi:hypothetical protein
MTLATGLRGLDRVAASPTLDEWRALVRLSILIDRVSA